MKAQNKINTKHIFSLLIGLGFLTVILLAGIIASLQDNPGRVNQSPEDSQKPPIKTTETNQLCVVKDINTTTRWITLLNVNSREELTLSYHGGTNVTDKYNKVISMKQVTIGSMVDATYQQSEQKLVSMNISKIAWEFDGAKRVGLNLENQTLEIANVKYQYTNTLSVYDLNEFVPVSSLAEQDELTVWGFDKTIWSIIVKKGHGTVRIENYQEYLGYDIKIGREPVREIVEGLELIVKEGEQTLKVENGPYSAQKNIKVERNQITYVSLNDLGRIGPQTGLVLFQVMPYGADLYVDGKLTFYSEANTLAYGKHTLKAMLGGYQTYEGSFMVDSDSKTIKIKLPVQSSSENPSAEESDATLSVTPGPTPPTNQNLDTQHKIYIQSPVGTSLYIDGSFIGTVPCTYQKIIGFHVLTFIKEGFQTKSYSVDILDNDEDVYFNYPELTKSN